MHTPTNLIGRKRSIFNLYVKLVVFLYFSREVITGKLPRKGFFGFLDRLLYFLSKMKENKYVRTDGGTKINLYVPAFPSKAFFKACAKVVSVGEKQPCISVLLSVTSGCRFRCQHCYQKHDRGKDVPIENLVDVVGKLDAMGVAFFNIEGGDPFLAWDRLKAVCGAVRVGEIWVNSTGDGMTPARLTELATMGVKGIMFSLHAPDADAVNRFMGRDNAWDTMMRGIDMCHAAGLDVAVNTCLLKDAFFDGTFEKVMELTRSLGVTIIQLIKPKPSGAWLGSKLNAFTQEDLDYIGRIVFAYNNLAKYREFPFIAAQIHDERPDMFGCTAGGTDRFYLNAKGDVQPCEFLNISFGNIQDEPFEEIYARMRTTFDVPGDRWLCEVCSDDIHAQYVASGGESLPLNPARSAAIHEHWDRGNCPDFYQYVETKHRSERTTRGGPRA